MAPHDKNRTVTIITGAIGAVAFASALALALRTAATPPKIANSVPSRIQLTQGTDTRPNLLETPSTPAPLARVSWTEKRESPRSALGRQIQTMADQLYAVDAESHRQDAELEKLAENLNTAAVQELTHTALDTSRSQNERFVAVYVIGQRASRFTKELTEIARSQINSADEAEIAVRLQAMAALDSLAAMEPKLTNSIFQTLEREHQNPLLQKVARLGMKGAREGHPLIQKYLDMSVAEVLDESN